MSDKSFRVTRDDGSYLLCDPSGRLRAGNTVCLLYPQKNGERQQASWAGTLKSLSRRSGIGWVVFNEGEWEITKRIDMRDGYTVVRVIGEMIAEPV